MAVTPAQHAAHTGILQRVRQSFGLPKMPDLGDIRLNKSGTIGTEPIGKVQPNGSVKRFTELKFGKLGKIDIPRKS